MRLALVVLVAVVMATGALAIQQATAAQGARTTVENESITPSAGQLALDHSNQARTVYPRNDTITITDSTGDTVQESGNYSWLKPNGTLDIETGSYLAGESSANVTYSYRQYSTDSWGMLQLATGLFEIGGLLILPLGFGAILVTVGKALGAL